MSLLGIYRRDDKEHFLFLRMEATVEAPWVVEMVVDLFWDLSVSWTILREFFEESQMSFSLNCANFLKMEISY